MADMRTLEAPEEAFNATNGRCGFTLRNSVEREGFRYAQLTSLGLLS